LAEAATGSAVETPPVVLLDGANLVWAYGHALSRRFGCKIYPSSAGLLLALEYEVRGGRRAGVGMLLLQAHPPPLRPGARRVCV
jgi:hypothetical protein